MSQQNALLVALNALQAIDNEHPYPIAKHAIVQLSKALAQPEQEPWDTSDMAHRAGGLTIDNDEIQKYKRPWIGLSDTEAEIYGSQLNGIRLVKGIDALLRQRNT